MRVAQQKKENRNNNNNKKNSRVFNVLCGVQVWLFLFVVIGRNFYSWCKTLLSKTDNQLNSGLPVAEEENDASILSSRRVSFYEKVGHNVFLFYLVLNCNKPRVNQNNISSSKNTRPNIWPGIRIVSAFQLHERYITSLSTFCKY